MIQWLKTNQGALGAFFGALVVIALVHFWPELKTNQDVIHLFVELLLTALMLVVPSLRPSKRKDDPQ